MKLSEVKANEELYGIIADAIDEWDLRHDVLLTGSEVDSLAEHIYKKVTETTSTTNTSSSSNKQKKNEESK